MRLGLRYLDTGAMYRAVTLHCMLKGVHLDNPKEIAGALKDVHLRVELTVNGPMRVYLGDKEVTDKIRTQEVTRNIHYVADVTGDARDEIIVWDAKSVWIYTQDRPFTGSKIYAPVRNPDYNESNYRTTVSMPAWKAVK